MRAAQELFSIGIYSVHIRTRKFRNLAKTKRYVVPAPRANSKTQGGTRIDSDSICHRHHSVFRVFKRSEYSLDLHQRSENAVRLKHPVQPLAHRNGAVRQNPSVR